ncbi:Uncharacterised protein [Vibrio cholerae]|nr:Uncharacterised protein [Vibrio cholerae]
MFHTKIDQFTFTVETLAVHDLSVGFFKRCRNLVLHNLDTGFVTNHFFAFFDCASTANIQTNRSVEFQCVTASGGFWVTKHHTNLHTNLVDEDTHTVGLLEVTRQFTHRLRQHTRLKTHVAIAHFAFDFRFWCQSRD